MAQVVMASTEYTCPCGWKINIKTANNPRQKIPTAVKLHERICKDGGKIPDNCDVVENLYVGNVIKPSFSIKYNSKFA